MGERDEESRRCVPYKSTEENTLKKRYKTTQNYLITDHITKYGDVTVPCTFTTKLSNESLMPSQIVYHFLLRKLFFTYSTSQLNNSSPLYTAHLTGSEGNPRTTAPRSAPMATYVPHHLVHAHLPAPPSIPASIPELHVPVNESIPIPDEAYEEPLHPDHAISVVHDTAKNILARNICNGYVLELRPFGPTIAKLRPNIETGSEVIRIFFPEPLRPLSPGLIQISDEEDRLFIIVISQANVVYRLNFPLGTFRKGTDDRFIFTTQGEEWLEDWEVPEHLISACGGVGATTVLNGETVILGGGDGGIVIVTRSGNYSPGAFSEFDLCIEIPPDRSY